MAKTGGRDRSKHLTARERQVLDSLVGGHTDQEIAQELGLSLGTIKSYMVRIRRRSGHRSRVALAVAHKQGAFNGPAA